MWEDNLGKVKARRSKNSKPYERPKSILRRVTDSVTGLLPQPSWLVNWLQSTSPKKEDSENDEIEEEQPVPSTSSSSNGNSSHQEGVERESFIFRRPPGTSKEQSNMRAHSNVPALDLFPEPVVVESSSREQIVQTNGDDDSNSESTSGCSSLLPHPEHKRESRNIELSNLGVAEPLSINQSSLQIIGSSLSKSLAVDLKSSRGRKTLSLHTFGHDSSSGITPIEDSRFHKITEEASGSFFDKDDTLLNRSAAKRDLSQPQLSSFGSKRPRFNITSFGPTAAEARRSLFNESVVDSPFYAGRTTYGGASAYRRATLQPSTTLFPYVRSRIQARPSNITSAPPTPSGSVAPTTSSKVVLSSSAQRILQALEAMSTPVRDAKRIPAASNSKRSTSLQGEDLSFTGFGLSRRRPNLGPPTSKLSVGTPAQIVTRPAPANLSQVEPTPVSSTPISAQVGGKIRMRMSAPLRKSAPRIREEEDVESEELTAVPMPISIAGLPSFNLLPPRSVVATETVVSTSVKTAAVISSNGLVSSSMTNTPVTRPAFTFSAPLVTVSPYEVDATITSKPLSFNFSSPLLVKSVTKETPEKETTRPPELELKSGSVLDVLRGKSQEAVPVSEAVSKSPPVLSGFGDKFKAPTDSWTCSVCCVTNTKDKSSCVACESPAPKPVKAMPIAAAAAAPSTKGFGDQFKITATQWECSVCMVRNSDKDDRCKSCEEARPGYKTAVIPCSVSNFKFGFQPGQQTGTTFGAESSSSIQTKGFAFGTPSEKEESSSGFKFGASVEVPKDKNVTTGFKFGNVIESKKIEAISSESGFDVVEPNKISGKGGFRFGTSIEPSKETEETSSGFKFGNDKKTEETRIATGSLPVASENTEPIELFQIKPKEPTQKAEEPLVLGRARNLETEEVKKTVTDSQFKISALPNQAATGFNVASTTTTSASKLSPIFSFGTGSVVPDSKVSSLETGSVMDILGKKPAAPSDFKQAPVSSAPTFSFGGTVQTKPSFPFAKTEISTENPTLNFGETTEKESQISKSSSSIPTTTSTSFSFTGGATSTPSLSLFKPSTAPSFNFGGPTVFGGSVSTAAASTPTFGVPTTVTSTIPSFGITTSAPAPTTFGLPTTTAAPIAFGLPAATTSLPTFGLQTATAAPTTFGIPAATAAPSSFGLPTTSSVTRSTVGSAVPASSSSIFTFGSGAGAAPTTSTSTAAAPSMAFSFGTPQTSTASFNFGSSAPPPYQFPKDASKPSSSSGFGFSVPTTAVPTSTTPAGGVFSFGSSNVATPATTPSEPPKMQFSFGTAQQAASSTVAAPTFGSFGASAPKTTSAPFSVFNPTSSSTPAFGEMAQKSSAPAFGATASTPFGSLPPTGFGAAASASATSASPFSFGVPSASVPSAFTASSSFNFSGSAAPVAAVPPQQPAGLFQFGGSTSTPAVNSGFSFSPAATFTTPDAPSPGFASGFLGANPFDNTGSAGGPNRKIRKAVRRR